jgi:acyl-CoA synthetase (AMP-forming)/AMP-acid ligase II
MGEAAIVMKYDTIHHVLGKEGLDVKGAQQSNRPEMVVAYYACFKLGAIAAPLRTAFTLTGYFEGDNYIQHNPQIGPMSQAQR